MSGSRALAPPPSSDLLRWGRGAGAKSAGSASPRDSAAASPRRGPGECRGAPDARRRRLSAQGSRAGPLRVRKLRAPVAPERPGGEATPSSGGHAPGPPSSPGAELPHSARPTPSSWRHPNGEEHRGPPRETRGRMEREPQFRMEYCSDSVGDPALAWYGSQKPFRFTARLSSGSSSN